MQPRPVGEPSGTIPGREASGPASPAQYGAAPTEYPQTQPSQQHPQSRGQQSELSQQLPQFGQPSQQQSAHPQQYAAAASQQPVGQVGQQPSPAQTQRTTTTGTAMQSGSEMGSQLGMQTSGESVGSLRGSVNVDIVETPDEIRVFADVPGFDPDDVEVLCDDSTLTLLARRTVDDDEDATWIQRERATEIQRQLQLPARAVVDEAEATCENGVCTITLPKSEEGRQKRIGFQ